MTFDAGCGVQATGEKAVGPSVFWVGGELTIQSTAQILFMIKI
jgi:hypothetical protein